MEAVKTDFQKKRAKRDAKILQMWKDWEQMDGSKTARATLIAKRYGCTVQTVYRVIKSKS